MVKKKKGNFDLIYISPPTKPHIKTPIPAEIKTDTFTVDDDDEDFAPGPDGIPPNTVG